MDQVDRHIGRNIGILAQMIHEISQQHTLDEASGGALSCNQLKILKAVAYGDAITVADLARLLHVSGAAASKNIERLVQLKMLARRRLPADRRRFRLELRPTGSELLDRYDRIGAAKVAHLMEHFDAAEKVVLLDCLRRVIRFSLADVRGAEMVCLQRSDHCDEDCVLKDSRHFCHAQKEVGTHVQPS
jgi:DNA-binding MarR family transcriptional regulator